MPWRPLLVVAGISTGVTTAIAVLSAATGWTVHSPAWALLAPLAMWGPALQHHFAVAVPEVLHRRGERALAGGGRHSPALGLCRGQRRRLRLDALARAVMGGPCPEGAREPAGRTAGVCSTPSLRVASAGPSRRTTRRHGGHGDARRKPAVFLRVTGDACGSGARCARGGRRVNRDKHKPPLSFWWLAFVPIHSPPPPAGTAGAEPDHRGAPWLRASVAIFSPVN